jgi:hypothetical protein
MGGWPMSGPSPRDVSMVRWSNILHPVLHQRRSGERHGWPEGWKRVPAQRFQHRDITTRRKSSGPAQPVILPGWFLLMVRRVGKWQWSHLGSQELKDPQDTCTRRGVSARGECQAVARRRVIKCQLGRERCGFRHKVSDKLINNLVAQFVGPSTRTQRGCIKKPARIPLAKSRKTEGAWTELLS